jgi:hypothetical protein
VTSRMWRRNRQYLLTALSRPGPSEMKTRRPVSNCKPQRESSANLALISANFLLMAGADCGG